MPPQGKSPTSSVHIFVMADAVELDALLRSVARGITAAQGELDRVAAASPQSPVPLPEGEVHLRPLWFVFGKTTLELELSTFVARGTEGFACKVLDPVTVALHGRAELSTTKLRVEIAPFGLEHIAGNEEE